MRVWQRDFGVTFRCWRRLLLACVAGYDRLAYPPAPSFMPHACRAHHVRDPVLRLCASGPEDDCSSAHLCRW